jgi:hypothetical protein
MLRTSTIVRTRSASNAVRRDTIFPRIGRLYAGSSMPLSASVVTTTVPGSTPTPPDVPVRKYCTSVASA